MKKFIHIGSYVLVAIVITIFVRTTFAGSLTPSATPASTMYTLDGIYNKLIDNTTSQVEGSQSFTTPISVSATFHTLKQIYESIPTLDATKILTGTTYMGVAGTLTQRGLPKTGQTTCLGIYVENEGIPSTIPCTGTTEDGELQNGLVHNYVDNGDATITDNATGLMWQKCSKGQTGLGCAGGSASLTTFDLGDSGNSGISNQPALNYCYTLVLASYSDWRLPNVRELESIVDYGTNTPSVNTTYFPSVPVSGQSYWSSSSYLMNGDGMYTVNFVDGLINHDGLNGVQFVRCVR